MPYLDYPGPIRHAPRAGGLPPLNKFTCERGCHRRRVAAPDSSSLYNTPAASGCVPWRRTIIPVLTVFDSSKRPRCFGTVTTITRQLLHCIGEHHGICLPYRPRLGRPRRRAHSRAWLSPPCGAPRSARRPGCLHLPVQLGARLRPPLPQATPLRNTRLSAWVGWCPAYRGVDALPRPPPWTARIHGILMTFVFDVLPSLVNRGSRASLCPPPAAPRPLAQWRAAPPRSRRSKSPSRCAFSCEPRRLPSLISPRQLRLRW